MNLEEYKNGINQQVLQIESFKKSKPETAWTYEDSKEFSQDFGEVAYKIQIYELIACVRYLLNKQ